MSVKNNDVALGMPLSNKAVRLEILYDEVFGEKRVSVAKNGEIINVIEGDEAEKLLHKLTDVEIELNANYEV